MSSGRSGGDLDPYTTAAISAVANPDNWRGLSPSQKADLQREIDSNLTPEQRRLVRALVNRRK